MNHAISKILHTLLGGTRIAVMVLAGALADHAGAEQFGVRILPTLGGQQGFASGINASGWSTGEANDPRGDSLAVLWSPEGTVSVLPTDQLGAGRAINDRNHVVGFDRGGAVNGTLWAGGTRIPLRPLAGGQSANLGSLNNHDISVGSTYQVGGVVSIATRWSPDGTPTALPTPEGLGSAAMGINDAGLIVGYTLVGTSRSDPVLWDGSTMTPLQTLGGDGGIARAINESGFIAGDCLRLGYTHATAWQADGTVVDLDRVAGSSNVASYGMAIDEAGEVVGMAWAAIGDPYYSAMLWSKGKVVDLNSFLDAASRSTWRLESATGINDDGSIVGNAVYLPSGLYHPFLLAPVPEPGAVALWVLGLCTLLLRARRARPNRLPSHRGPRTSRRMASVSFTSAGTIRRGAFIACGFWFSRSCMTSKTS